MQEARIRDVLNIFWQEARKQQWTVLLIFLFILLSTGADAIQPFFIKQLFDLLEASTPTVSTVDVFVPILVTIASVKLASWLCWRVMALASNRFQPKAMVQLEQFAFHKLLNHSHRFFADNFGGSLVRKVSRFSRAFERLADEVQFRMIPTAIVLAGAIIGLGLQFPALAWIFIVWVSLFLLFQYVAARWAVKADIRRAELDSRSTGVLADAVTNAISIKLFSSRKEEEARFRDASMKYARANTRSWDNHEVIFAIQGFFMIALEVALLYLGVALWIDGTLTLGDLAFIQTYLILVFSKLWEVSRTFRHLYDAFADAKEMTEIVHMPVEVRDRVRAKPLHVRRGRIAFKDVTFRYTRKRTILDHFTLNVRPGEKVALVGPSGAGKSTITKLLLRFYDIQKGAISIDNQNIARVTQASLRDSISLVPQDTTLFHRTLMENIRYGRRDATDEEVIEAAKQAHCHEFISQLPNGYGTYVGERGIKLSGGERQRVAIARAILKDAPILLLDEATSALDSESELLIQDALRELMKNKTVISIAHRLSTIMMMDRIVVMEKGRIADIGSHADLVKNRGIYERLWNIQAGAFDE